MAQNSIAEAISQSVIVFECGKGRWHGARQHARGFFEQWK